MDDAATIYLKTLHDHAKFYGTWLPGVRVQVGEVGRLDADGLYRYSTQLKQVGIGFATETIPYQDIHFATEGSVDVSGGLEAKTTGPVSVLASAQGAFTLSFSSANAVAVILRDVELERIQDEEQLRHDMLAAWNASPRRLETDHVVVTKVYKAGSGALAMSADSNAQVGATASVALAPGKIQLADIKGKLAIVGAQGARFAISVEDGDPPLTPMFEMLHFTKNRLWWRFWRPLVAVGTRGPQRPVDFDDSTGPGDIVGLAEATA